MPVIESGSPSDFAGPSESSTAADVPALPKSLKDMSREELLKWYADLRNARHVIETSSGPRPVRAKAPTAATKALDKEL